MDFPDLRISLLAWLFDELERQRLFRAQAALMPNFDEYQKATTRQIPVVVLERT